MTRKSFERALLGFCSRRQFVPFIIELVSGATFVAPHPEAVGFRGELIAFARPDGFDSESVCRLLDRPLRAPAAGPAGT
jgi:hypothetical protein